MKISVSFVPGPFVSVNIHLFFVLDVLWPFFFAWFVNFVAPQQNKTKPLICRIFFVVFLLIKQLNCLMHISSSYVLLFLTFFYSFFVGLFKTKRNKTKAPLAFVNCISFTVSFSNKTIETNSLRCSIVILTFLLFFAISFQVKQYKITSSWCSFVPFDYLLFFPIKQMRQVFIDVFFILDIFVTVFSCNKTTETNFVLMFSCCSHLALDVFLFVSIFYCFSLSFSQ